MDLETTDFQVLRAHIERNRSTFLSDTSKTVLSRGVAVNVAMSVSLGGGPLVETIKKLHLPGEHRSGWKDGTYKNWRVSIEESNDEFRAAYEAIVSQLNALEDLQSKIRANASLSNTQARDRALQAIAERDSNGDDKVQWSNDLQNTAFLSTAQISDAIEHWKNHGAIEIITLRRTLTRLDGFAVCQLRLTPRGRDIASGEVQNSLNFMSPITVVQHSTIASLGPNYGTVNQNVTTRFPEIPADVRSVLEGGPVGSILVESFSEELAKPQPREAKLRQLLSGFKEIVEGANVATEVAVHWQEWQTSALHFISSVFPH